MNLTSSSEPGKFLTNSSPGMRANPDTAIVTPDLLHGNESLLTRGANLTGSHNATLTPALTYDPLGGHTIWQVILIVCLTGPLSLVTIIGNILVLVSFKVNKQLKTVNNYYLLSLAFADLIIGVLSMNLYTTYIIMDQWALGNWACDLWLAIDYVASNASVMNLLVISFDRYFSVTRPLTYRAKRTTKRAMTMIGLAWSISFVLWAPAILFWQFFVGERSVKLGECYIQFLTEPITTFCTAIAAFYLPVTIMTVLYWRIYKETENRSKDLAGLRGLGNQGKQGSQQDETSAMVLPPMGSSRSCSSYELGQSGQQKGSGRGNIAGRFRFWLASHKGHSPSNTGEVEHSSSDSWNNNEGGISVDQSDEEDEEEAGFERQAVYSITAGVRDGRGGSVNALEEDAGMSEHVPLKPASKNDEIPSTRGLPRTASLSTSTLEASNPAPTLSSPNSKSPTAPAPISLKDAALAKRFAFKAKTQISKRKKTSLVKEKKAAQTLSAILFAFIITWTPYNIMVLVNTFCKDCIPQALWALGYWLCYVNSTVNPMCYALCNKTFRTTFRMILLCQWDRQKQNKPHFQQRQPATAVAYRKKQPL